ncbi:MAG: hypothetical protein BAJATHORv1_20275 [Candidatus Thorarchaeota archaeon]|nr:MAG: hypothetical protein BAJATHORv1_20275 [Candidatus Thorarchaeota archaeon]
MEELIPEDGSFRGSTGFRWTRNVALYWPGDSKYGFSSFISKEDAEIVKRGIKTKGIVPQYNLSMGKLEKLKNHEDMTIREAAERVDEAIQSNQSRLLLEEAQLARDLGISIACSPVVVKLYPSGKVSVKWRAETPTKEDAIKWALRCPPHDVHKSQKVDRWLRKILEDSLDEHT